VGFCSNSVLSEDEYTITPWLKHVDQMRLRFECMMTADLDSGAQWKHFCLGMHARRWEGEQEMYFDSAHHMAHALAMLPWTLK